MPKEAPLVKGIIRKVNMDGGKEGRKRKGKCYQNDTNPNRLCWSTLIQNTEQANYCHVSLKDRIHFEKCILGPGCLGSHCYPFLNSGHWAI